MSDQNVTLPTLSYLLLDPSRPFIHRDLSWIQFNDRVLAEARTRVNPFLKRLKFLSISSSNLDEFFMIRFASLQRSLTATKNEEARANLQRVHGTVLESVRKFGGRQKRTLELLRQESGKRDFFLHLGTAPGTDAFAMGREVFQEKILPFLEVKTGYQHASLQALQNLQMLVFLNKEIYFELPRSLPATYLVTRAGVAHVFFLDDLILSHLDHMLPIKDRPGILRLTRDSDFTVDLSDSDPESVPDLIRKNLGTRDKGRFVRLQYAGHFPKDFVQEAADQLKLDLRQCLKAPGSLCLHGLLGLTADVPEELASRPGQSNPPHRPVVPETFSVGRGGALFKALRELDFLLHHPYDSFEAFLVFLRQAVDDPAVTMIEQTIYRTDSSSEIVELLKKAAAKKRVRVALELRARFDESNNLKVAEELSKAGAEVRFGFGALKLHAKITLVTRAEEGGERRYTHLATGNYNAKTSRLYTDISIVTGHPEIGDDGRVFFDALFKNEVPSNFKQLVTAPIKLHQKIRSLVKAETEAARAGNKGRIFAKVNALVDEKIIEDLYAASQAGVQVDLVVRGACSLIPGVKGLSENIRVTSIVDRFLEHSRIYYFEHSNAIYLSSADWMPRNFFSRLEIAFPVLDPRLYRFLVENVIPGYLRDNVKARRLNARGRWMRPSRLEINHRAQGYFEDLAAKHYVGTALYDHEYFRRK